MRLYDVSLLREVSCVWGFSFCLPIQILGRVRNRSVGDLGGIDGADQE